MSANHRLVRAARDEWSDWLGRPDLPKPMTPAETARWIKSRPPLNAFQSLVEIIDYMQDDIDLLNIKIKALEKELSEAKRLLTTRI